MYFSYAQPFFMAPTLVKNAKEVSITRVDLYFRAKPRRTGNKSGIKEPGVSILVVPTLNGLPQINQLGAYRPTEPTEHGAKFAFYSSGRHARVEYDDIVPSTDASIPTTFMIKDPVVAQTGQELAILVKFDGAENFVLWRNVQGETLVGTDKTSDGPSSRLVGDLFRFIDNPNKQTGSANGGYGYTSTPIDPDTEDDQSLIYSPNNAIDSGHDTQYLQSNWLPLTGQSLKFELFVARYSQNGVPFIMQNNVVQSLNVSSALDHNIFVGKQSDVKSNNVIRIPAPCQEIEFITFDAKSSKKESLSYGEEVFQVVPEYPGGVSSDDALSMNIAPTTTGGNTDYETRKVVANGAYVLPGGKTFSENGGFSNLVSPGQHIVFHFSNNSVNEIFSRRVLEIESNTQILVDRPFKDSFVGATMSFPPVGFVYAVERSKVFGVSRDLLTLYNSVVTKNSRFVSYALESIEIANSGTGYSNSDFLRIEGFEDIDFSVKGNYRALANIVTNGNGEIQSVFLSNAGAGFVNTGWLTGSNVRVLQSNSDGTMTSVNSAGTGGEFTFNVNSVCRSLMTNTEFSNCVLENLDAHRMKPEITLNNPLGTNFSLYHRTLYYSVKDQNTHSQRAFYINTPEENARTETQGKIFRGINLKSSAPNRSPCIPSKSNELAIRYANGGIANASVTGERWSNSSVLLFDITSNNDFTAVWVDPEIINSHYGQYIINREYTREHTNYGKAFAKHVTKKVRFQDERFSEDVLAYLTCYRPGDTDILLYAKLHNSSDDDPFNDKDWTLLEKIEGTDSVFSSKENSSDFIEIVFGLPAYPNTEFSLDGSVEVRQGNAFVEGTQTQLAARANIVANGTGYSNGDIVNWSPPEQTAPATGIFALEQTANARATITTDASGEISSLEITKGGLGWTDQDEVNDFEITNSSGGDTGGTGANVSFYPGLFDDDLVKIYSHLDDFANTNYVLATVNSVANSTRLEVKRTFGEVGANLTGTADVSSGNTITGSNTEFSDDFSNGDFVAVWANSTTYEVRKVTEVTNDVSMSVENDFTFTNSTSNYSFVTPSKFLNNSTSVDKLKIDRIAYQRQAFNDVQNGNLATYYDSTGRKHVGFDSYQLKIVLLGEDNILVPKIDDVRAVMVSA